MRIDAALRRVQSKACLTGMAGRWHVAKASSILETPTLVKAYVVGLDEPDRAIYLEHLPALIAKTKEYDQHCQAAWHFCAQTRGKGQFVAERRKLLRLFRSFQFRPILYERVVRATEKPLLRQARDVLAANLDTSEEATRLEAIVRMRLHEFVASEENIAADLRDLDAARAQLSAAYQWLAREISDEQEQSDEKTWTSAIVGLQRAAARYDYKEGFSFAPYAREWILEAIEKRRG